MSTYTGAPDECDRCWPNKRHDGPCLWEDLPAIKDEVAKIVIEKGFVSNREQFDKYVAFSSDQERAEGIVGYPAAGFIYAELGPDQHDAYWLDYVWQVLFEKFPKWEFGVYNCAVLSVFRNTSYVDEKGC